MAMIKFQLSTSQLEWVLYFLDLLSWEELMLQTQNLPWLPLFLPSVNLPKWIVTLDKLHKLCSTISKLTNCPHGWKPTSDPKPQPTVGIFPNYYFFLRDHLLNVEGQHPKILHQPEKHKAVHKFRPDVWGEKYRPPDYPMIPEPAALAYLAVPLKCFVFSCAYMFVYVQREVQGGAQGTTQNAGSLPQWLSTLIFEAGSFYWPQSRPVG